MSLVTSAAVRLLTSAVRVQGAGFMNVHAEY
jgi:hypothetical protein